MVTHFEVNALTAGVNNEVARMKIPVVSKTVTKEFTGIIIRNPMEVANKDSLITSASPHRLVKGPVINPCVRADTSPTTIRMVPTCPVP
jgi:hypothetical protein